MNGTDRGKLEERQLFLRKERVAQHDFYETMKRYPAVLPVQTAVGPTIEGCGIGST